MTNATVAIQTNVRPGAAALVGRKVTLILAGGMSIPVIVPTASATANRLITIAKPIEPDPIPIQVDRADDLAWLSANRREARKYAGQWIAIDDGKLIATAPTLEGVLQVSKSSGHPDPLVTAIPTDEPAPFFGCHLTR